MKTLRIGLVGSGFIAGVHVGALKQIDGVEIVGVVSLNTQLASEFCEKQGLEAKPYADVDTMLDEANLDAMYVCLPPFAHQGEVQAAAAKGVHVFLEKPIAINSEIARDMVTAIENAGVVSQVGFMMRFRESVRKLKQRMESGDIGKPTLFSGRYWVNMEGSDWWRDPKLSGGQMFEQAIHLYDLAHYLCGDVERAHGLVRNLLHPDHGGEDTSIGILEFENGALGSITGSNCAVEMNFIADFSVVFEKGTLEYRCNGQPWVEPDHGSFRTADGKREEFTEAGDAFLEENRHFIDCVREGKQTLCPARDGLRAIETVEQVLASARGK